jgi:pimeloyl-ACP methyl ester carboxylesterase
MYSDTYLTKSRKFLPLLARVTKPADYDRFLKNARAILNFDVRGELSKISCPTLIIAGGDDHVVGKEAAIELHKGITGSGLYVYDGLGHGAYEEAKDFYDRVFAFFSCR